jgi:hypothetical protein
MSDLNDLLQERGPDAVRAYLDASAARAILGDGHNTATPPHHKDGSEWRIHIVTAEALRKMSFPPTAFVVPGLIPEGLSMLAGRPKVGKSWFALDICIAVATGRLCLGNRQPREGDVLYCALEDNQRRLQRRLDKLVSPFSTSWPERLQFATSWRRLDEGGIDDVASWADDVDDPRLVVIDTLARVRPVRTARGYIEDYEALGPLQRFTNERGIAVLVLHHVRKMEADDPLDTVSGTLGLTGCADTVLVLVRSTRGMTLYVRGRDVEEAEHAVDFDKTTCRWSILGQASEVHRSPQRNVILSVFAKSNKTLGPQEIADVAQMSETNVRKLMTKMVKAGELKKHRRGKYGLPEEH